MKTQKLFSGWQTVAAAARKIGVSRQMIHLKIENESLDYYHAHGRYWVRDPLPYKPRKAVQEKARIARKHKITLDNMQALGKNKA